MRTLLVVLWAALILILTSLPASTVPEASPFPHFDKLVHGSLYAVLAVLALRVDRRGGRTSAQAPTILFLVACFAAIDEWHQRLVPGRQPSWGDWSADVLGATVGAVLFQLSRTRREIKRS
ncbi:MAG: VanZ family protein [Gemmatimonadota bacterium]